MPVTAVRDEGALRMWVCRLPVHIDPAECTVFYGNLRRIRDFPMGRQSRRPLQQVSALPVGADDSVRPQDVPLFSEIFGEFVASQRADVGIGPYNRMCRCIRIRRGFPIVPCFPPGGHRAPPLPSLRRIRTALQILNAVLFYSRYQIVTTYKSGVP